VQWDAKWCACSIRIPEQLLREHLRSSVAATGIPDRDKPAKTPRSTSSCCHAAAKIRRTLGTLAEQMYRRTARPPFAAFLGLTAWRVSMGRRSPRRPVLPRWNPASRANPYQFVRRVSSSAGRNCTLARWTPSFVQTCTPGGRTSWRSTKTQEDHY